MDYLFCPETGKIKVDGIVKTVEEVKKIFNMNIKGIYNIAFIRLVKNNFNVELTMNYYRRS
jgi:ABC-type polysaccharide/polyol phosphate transport system ATPase subunit